MTVPAGPLLSDALISSPIVVGEDGTGAVPGGYEFGIDPNEDPELALVRLSASLSLSVCLSPCLSISVCLFVCLFV